MNSKIKTITYNGFVASLYVILTLISYPLSFGQIQIRFSEMLILLCFFRKDYIFGLTAGCLITNLFSSLGMVDCFFGTLATLLSCLLISFSKYLLISIAYPIIINALTIGFELYHFMQLDFLISSLLVGLGELIALILGYIVFRSFKNNTKFFDFIRANQNRDYKF